MRQLHSRLFRPLHGIAACSLALLAGCGGGSGSTLAANVPAAPTPPATHAVGGTVAGLAGSGAVTLSNGTDTVQVAANGSFSFPTRVTSGASYHVNVASHAPGHECSVKNGSGTVGNADANTIEVACMPFVLAGRDAAVKLAAGMAFDAAGNLYVADKMLHVIHRITPAGEVSLHAGVAGQSGYADGPASSAKFFFNHRAGMAFDREGNLYVVDSCNYMIRRIGADRIVTTVAGSGTYRCGSNGAPVEADGNGKAASFFAPGGMSLDRDGNLLVADVTAIRKVTPAGQVSTFFRAGRPAGLPFGAPFVRSVSDVAVDSHGNVFALPTFQSQYVIWKIAGGTASIFAGDAVLNAPVDGTGTAARFFIPNALSIDRNDNLYVADQWLVRKVTPAAVVTTLAGSGTESGNRDGAGTAARFMAVNRIAADADGNLVVADGSARNLRRITQDGQVSAIVPASSNFGYKDGKGAEAEFGFPRQPAIDATGNTYLVDPLQHVVRQVTPSGEVRLYAGAPGTSGDADGPRTTASFRSPQAIAADAEGNLYLVDNSQTSSRVRKIAKDGTVSTLAALPVSYGAGFLYMAVSHNGNVAVADEISIFQVTPAGQVRHVIGRRTQPFNDAPGTMPRLLPETIDGISIDPMAFAPQGLAYDATGNLYIADGIHHLVYRLAADGSIGIHAGKPFSSDTVEGPKGTASLAFHDVTWMAIDAGGNLYLTGSGRLRKVTPAGEVSTPVLPWGYPALSGIAIAGGRLVGTTRNAVMQVNLK